ncbi:Phospholipid phosphatase-related protein type 1 [Varanus komodoensis]|nr:Phospholipid phosphatase-related protein type 1 [Varanus komodoensis]
MHSRDPQLCEYNGASRFASWGSQLMLSPSHTEKASDIISHSDNIFSEKPPAPPPRKWGKSSKEVWGGWDGESRRSKDEGKQSLFCISCAEMLLREKHSGEREIFIGEISMYFIKSTRESLIVQEKTILTGECCYLNPLLRRIIRFIGVFAFGLFATDIFVNAGQVVTGNLTPYFLTVCKPNYTGSDCRAHHPFVNNGNICTGDQEVIEKARRSFPSKHAALSIYSALYATMYITSTIKTKSSRLAKPVLCLGTLCAAFLTGLNRVSEYRNHCSDVIAGFILGSAVALFLGICVVHNFKGTHGTLSKSKPEERRGMPLMAFPRVESPLETLSAQVPSILPFRILIH